MRPSAFEAFLNNASLSVEIYLIVLQLMLHIWVHHILEFACRACLLLVDPRLPGFKVSRGLESLQLDFRAQGSRRVRASEV